jgi:putative addiction module component (TIGR02574 family)
MSAAQVLEQIEQLPVDEQREVFEQLRDKFDEFDDEPTPEQMAELERRAEELRKNPQAGIPWEQVREEARKRFGWKRDADLMPEQVAELDRRLADFENNPHEGIPWEQVEANLNQRFGWK